MSDAVRSDVAELIRSQSPMRDDPAGRVMVRARTEHLATGSSRRSMSWSRGLVAIAPALVLVVVIWASTPRSGGPVVTPDPTSGVTVAQPETVSDARPINPTVTGVPRRPRYPISTQAWSALSEQDRARVNAGLPPLAQMPRTGAETPTLNVAQSFVVLGQAPAPEALVLLQQMRR